MATCPDCGAFLHDAHRCRVNWWLVRASVLRDIVIAAAVVAIAAGLAFNWRDGQVSWGAVMLAGIAGGVIRWSLISDEPPHKRVRAS
jgi:hypothetical protein